MASGETLHKKTKTGIIELTLELSAGKDYQFRYFIDSFKWETDSEADALAPTSYKDVYNLVIKSYQTGTSEIFYQDCGINKGFFYLGSIIST